MKSRTLAPLSALSILAAPPLFAQGDEPVDRAPERCIYLNRVDRTEVIDDRTLIFHMRPGRQIYLNHLERECPGLRREERFMYSPTGNRLCEIDTITVLEQWGFGLTRGFTCGLGNFHPITQEDLAALKSGDESLQGEPSERQGEYDIEELDPEELDALMRERERDGGASAVAEAPADSESE